jgi:hypothetical protein
VQLRLSGSSDTGTDRMDQSATDRSNTAARKADTGVAAGADAASTAAAAVPPAEPPAGGYPAPTLQHLVLVAGHAVYTGVDFSLATKESSWFLEPYQQVVTLSSQQCCNGLQCLGAVVLTALFATGCGCSRAVIACTQCLPVRARSKLSSVL